MSVLQITVAFRLIWNLTTVFESSLRMCFVFPMVPEGFLEDRVLNVQCRVNPNTGRVTFGVHDPQDADPAITVAEQAV